MEPTETLTFLGTIAELKAELKASKIKHLIKDEDDAYLEVDLKGPIMISATVDLYGSRDKANARYARDNRDNRYTYAVRQEPKPLAKGIIKGIAKGSTIDLVVDLETDETMPMHKEVHERWQQFYAYLVSRGRLAQEPEAAAAQTEIDGGPEQEAAKAGKKHEALKCNQWLCRKYFDEGQTNYQELVREWLHIRQTQDYKTDPVNPVGSMRTAVNEEKKRRRRNQA